MGLLVRVEIMKILTLTEWKVLWFLLLTECMSWERGCGVMGWEGFNLIPLLHLWVGGWVSRNLVDVSCVACSSVQLPTVCSK